MIRYFKIIYAYIACNIYIFFFGIPNNECLSVKYRGNKIIFIGTCKPFGDNQSHIDHLNCYYCKEFYSAPSEFIEN